MDTFTKMVDHPLIQDGWVVNAGDLTDKGLVVAITQDRLLLIFKRVESAPLSQTIHTKESVIFKPSIEQLMGMVPAVALYKNTGQGLICATTVMGELFKGNTEKEALIQAVFHELHNLTWDGEAWTQTGR